jgi:hypothetical protein
MRAISMITGVSINTVTKLLDAGKLARPSMMSMCVT